MTTRFTKNQPELAKKLPPEYGGIEEVYIIEEHRDATGWQQSFGRAIPMRKTYLEILSEQGATHVRILIMTPTADHYAYYSIADLLG